MNALLSLLALSIQQTWISLTHNWPYLLASVVIAALLKLYLDPKKISAYLLRRQKAGVVFATVAAVGTPLCSCGTTAVVLGMLANTLPWAPIVAFLVASPLTSPGELFYSAGLFGWPFALAFFVSSILLGLLGGLVAAIFEQRGWLKNQSRYAAPEDRKGESQKSPALARPVGFAGKPSLARPARPAVFAQAAACCAVVDMDLLVPARIAASSSSPNLTQSAASPNCGCPVEENERSSTCGCPVAETSHSSSRNFSAPDQNPKARVNVRALVGEILHTGVRLMPMFFGFAFIGFTLNNLIPEAWVSALFGEGNIYSVPLAATLGLPFYINTEGSLPLVRALIDGGMSQGAALAFLITGAGTSAGAIMGMLTITRWRVIALVVAVLWAGSILLGFVYNFLLATHVF